MDDDCLISSVLLLISIFRTSTMLLYEIKYCEQISYRRK